MTVVSAEGFWSDQGRAGSSDLQNREKRSAMSWKVDGLPQILRPSSFCEIIGTSVETLYYAVDDTHRLLNIYAISI